MRIASTVLALGLVVGLSACGGDGPTAPSANTFDGTWTGSTSEGLTLTMTVVSGSTTKLQYQVGGAGAGAAYDRCRLAQGCREVACENLRSPAPISTSGQFTITDNATTSLHLSLTGTLSSTKGTGTGTYTIFGSTCSLANSFAWTMTRQ